MDTLRADHVGLYGYRRATTPNLDRWFAEAAVYTKSYSTEANTSPSVISILSGLYPQEHRVRMLYQRVTPELRLLPDLLPEAYQSAAFVSNMVLTDEAMHIASRFTHYDDFVDEREPYRNVYERNARRTTDAVLRWLSTKRDPKRPLFLWVHYMDPHGPYHPPKSWKFSFTHDKPRPIYIARVPEYQREPGITDGLEYVDRYDEEVAYTDTEIGRLLDRYYQMYEADDALIIFTADHGESMMEHEKWFTHGYHVYDEITRVPLMVRGPGVKAGRSDKLVSGIDITPTILTFAGSSPSRGMPPTDLRTGHGLSEGRVIFAEATYNAFLKLQQRAIVRRNKKWILLAKADNCVDGPRVLFDLEVDPKELMPSAFDPDAGPARMLVARCKRDPDPAGVPVELEPGLRLRAPKVAPGVSAENMERLKALGYVH